MTVLDRENYHSKFSKGQLVYYVGPPSATMKKDVAYKVINCVPKAEAYLGIVLELPDGRSKIDIVDNYISEQDQLKLKGNSPKEKTNNFKPGDIVYYNYPDNNFNHHAAFMLWLNPTNKEVFDIFVNKKRTSILKSFVNKRFISQEEYKNKYGVVREPDVPAAQVSNYDTFVRGIKTGDIVYYMGNKIERLQNNTPFKVEFYNPLTGLIKIEGGISSSEDFILADDYERMKMNDPNLKSGDKGKSKSDIEIKMVAYNDTRSGKMEWFKPYITQEEWFRSTIKLENPPDSYLRYDVLKTRMEGKWLMKIYYHRNKPESNAKNNSVQIKEFEDGQILKNLVDEIVIQMNKKEKDK